MRRLFILTIWASLLAAATCKANIIYDVSLDTSGLAGNVNGPFAVDFQLTSGDTTSGVVNTATLSSFTFGTGGSAGIGNPFALFRFILNPSFRPVPFDDFELIADHVGARVGKGWVGRIHR